MVLGKFEQQECTIETEQPDSPKRLKTNESAGEVLQKVDKKWTMIKKTTSMAIPSVLSSLIVYSLETINIIFAGKAEIQSDYTKMDILNAIGVGNIFINFGGLLFGMGMITSLETLCSQSYGKNDLKEMSKWVTMCNYFMTLYFILLCGVCLFSEQLIIILGQPDNIAKLASRYIYSLLPSFIIQYYMSSYTKLLNAQQVFNPVLYINLLCVLFHTLWCYIFYSVLGLGVVGLGYASNLTTLLMLIMIYTYVRVYKFQRSIKFGDITMKDLKIFVKMCIECGILSSIDNLGFEIISFIASYLPQNELDAYICVVNINNNIYAISIGFATAITTMVGNYMGENKPKKALKYSKIGILIDFGITVVISLCCIFFHGYIALLYIEDKKILNISSKLIRVVAIFIIFDALQLQLCAIIRGIGKQFLGMIIAVIIFIFFQTGICLAFVFFLKLGAFGLWFAQIICVGIASIVYFLVLKFSDWNELGLIASSTVLSDNPDLIGKDYLPCDITNTNEAKLHKKIYHMSSDSTIVTETLYND